MQNLSSNTEGKGSEGTTDEDPSRAMRAKQDTTGLAGEQQHQPSALNFLGCRAAAEDGSKLSLLAAMKHAPTVPVSPSLKLLVMFLSQANY